MIEMPELSNERLRHKYVPTDLIQNLRFRRDLLIRCENSRKWRDAITQVCREDVIFFFNSFCWCLEPRPRYYDRISRTVISEIDVTEDIRQDLIEMPAEIPFIAWEHQIPLILQIQDALGKRDIGVEKSRGEGASWIGILLAVHEWKFRRQATIGMVSKDEESADDPNDPNSLFWKIDFTLKMWPKWMAGERNVHWKRNLNQHTLINLVTGSSISAYAAVGNVARGGRARWFFSDELSAFPRPADRDAMAATQHVTESRLVVSTPLGAEGAYYDFMHEPSNRLKLVLDWKDNPTKNRGLYRLIEGKPVADDPINNPLPPDYDPPSNRVLEMYGRLRRRGFKLENRLRSPWYDNECDRASATPQNIAQELDRDYGGSSYRVFLDGFFTKAEQHLSQPLSVGDINFGLEILDQVRFDTVDGGPLKLWVPLDSLGNPIQRPYVFGCDISSGTAGSYTSNSTIVGFDQVSKEQVLEFAINSMPPAHFADYCIAICKWFHNAFLIWEANGPGTAFGKQVMERMYPSIYWRRSLDSRGNQMTKKAGWWTDNKSKEILCSQFGMAVTTGELTLRSKELKEECGRYVRKGDKIINALVQNAPEDSTGASHGDRTIAAAIAYQGFKARPCTQSETSYISSNPPEGSMAARMKEYDERMARERADDGWQGGKTLDSIWV